MPLAPEPTPAAAVLPRSGTIDLLRGFAILAVVLLHTFLRLLFAGYPLRPLVPPPWFHLIFRNGGNGVTLFFAISGFLITLTSIRRFGSLAAIRVRTFYRIRFARIAPLLLLIVAILSALALAHAPGFEFSAKRAPLWRAILAALTFHLNWLEARFGYLPANWDVMWTLSIEEAFYVFYPVLCAVLLRWRRGGMALLVLVLATFAAMGPWARSVWATTDIWQEKTYLGGMDGIALGCLTALLAHRLATTDNRWAARLALPAQLLGSAGLLLFAWGPPWLGKALPWKPDFYDSIFTLAACLVLLGSTLRTPQPARTAVRFASLCSRLGAPIRWYGRHSYEVYLTHEFLIVWGVLLFLRVHPNTNPDPDGVAPHQLSLLVMSCWIAGILLLTAPLGWLTARLFSEPLNRRLRGLRPSSP